MSGKNGKNGKRGFIKYKSYLFVEKDPVIDALRTAVSESKKRYTEIREDSGVSTTTMYGWFHGTTRRPQFATVAAVSRAVGKNSITLRPGSVRLAD